MWGSRKLKRKSRPNNLVRCDRQLLAKLRTLDGDQLAEKTKHYLTKDDVKAVMARRDEIARFQQLVSEKGELSCINTCYGQPHDVEGALSGAKVFIGLAVFACAVLFLLAKHWTL